MDLQSLITLEQQKQLMECSASSCMAEIGGAMGAQFVVVSSVGKLGSSFLLAATLVDTRTAQTVNSVTESVPGVDEGALPQAIPRVVYRLLQKGGLLRPGVADPGAGAARPDNAVAPPAAPPAVAPPTAAVVPGPTAPAPATPPVAPAPEEKPGSSGPRRSTLIGLSSIPAGVLGALGGVTAVLSLAVLVISFVTFWVTFEISEDVGTSALLVSGASGVVFPLALLGALGFGLVATVLVVVALVGRGAEKVEEIVSQKDDDRAVPVARRSVAAR